MGRPLRSLNKIKVPVGEKVILNVTSDANDEVHAHIGGSGYELQVKTGKPAKGEYTIDSPGSFEVESHHLEKIIVILNARLIPAGSPPMGPPGVTTDEPTVEGRPTDEVRTEVEPPPELSVQSGPSTRLATEPSCRSRMVTICGELGALSAA